MRSFSHDLPDAIVDASWPSSESSCVLGCSDDGLGKRYPVNGTVTYKGQAAQAGDDRLHPRPPPTAAVRPARSTDGTYSLTTQDPGDGAFPGSYKVTISR